MKHLYTIFTLLFIPSLLLAQQENFSPTYTGAFDGAIYENNVWNFPTGAQSWAGWSNANSAIYPLAFSSAGTITFTANTVNAGTTAVLKFKFEAAPWPNTEPSFFTSTVTINDTSASYSIDIASQGGNTFSSALMYSETQDVEFVISNVVITADQSADPNATLDEAFTGSSFTGADGLTYTESGGEGTVTNINGATAGANGSPWAHITKSPTGGFDFSGTDRGVKLRVKGPRNIPVLVKFQDGGTATEVSVNYTDAGNYQTLLYDFTADSETRNKVVIFFEINTAASADLADDLFYIDTFEFNEFATFSNETDFESNQFVTYPNPLQNTLNVRGTVEVDQVSIYDLVGRNVLNATPNKSEFSLDVSQLNKGVYMVQLKAGNKETTLKIVK